MVDEQRIPECWRCGEALHDPDPFPEDGPEQPYDPARLGNNESADSPGLCCYCGHAMAKDD